MLGYLFHCVDCGADLLDVADALEAANPDVGCLTCLAAMEDEDEDFWYA